MARYGFNFQWMYYYEKGKIPALPDVNALDVMADVGLDFVRIPLDYRFWIKDFKYDHPDESMLEFIDHYLNACLERNLHMSLNLHRAPGYCINSNHLEKHNLWLDDIARNAFVAHWEMFAERYRSIPSRNLSFDLVNEPPSVGQYGMTRENHETLMRRTIAAIHKIDPQREIVLNGLNGGNEAIPELADLDVIHSGRGYQPMPVTHYEAAWWDGSKGLKAPTYPGTRWEGQKWDRQALKTHYAPWRIVEAAGTRVHIGEFGCYNKVPNDLALRWFADLLSVFNEFGWGYALWNFKGPFGIAQHGREGARYEDFYGYQVDKDLLQLYLDNRAAPIS